MPKSFDPLLSNSSLWIPAAFTPAQARGARRPLPERNGAAESREIAIAQAQSELNVTAERLQKAIPA